MKKRTGLAIITAMAFIITGCGASSEKGTNSAASSLEVSTTGVFKTESTTAEGATEAKTTENDIKETTSETQSGPTDPSSVKAEVPAYYYTATKTGTISDADSILNTYGGLAIKTIANNQFKVYLPNGDLYPSDGTLSNSEYLGADLYTFRKTDGDDINTTCLMNGSGETLIPHEAAVICWIDCLDKSARRYLEVIYTTGKTDNKDEAFIYSTDNSFSMAYEAGDTLYKGYAKVYDTVKKRFVPDVQITYADRTALEAVGNAFTYADETGTKTLYDENGKAIVSCDTYYGETDGHVFIVKDDTGTYTVYNDAGEILNKSDKIISAVTGEGVLQCFDSDTQKNYIIDYAGNRLTKDEYDLVYTDSAGVLCVKQQSGELALIDREGNVIASIAGEGYSSHIPGYFHVENPDGQYTVYTAKGKVCDNCTERYKLLAKDESGKFFVWNTQSYSLELDPNATNTGTYPIGLVESANAEYKKGLYDVFNGNMILEDLYDSFTYDGQMIYGYKNDTQTWDIYKLTTNVPIP